MNQYPSRYLLDFSPIMEIIEQGIAQFPQWRLYHAGLNEHANKRDYVMYLLEWLNVKITDNEATSASDLGIAYLRRYNIDEHYAKEMSHYVMNCIVDLVTASFPNMTYRQLSEARYVLETDNSLSVYIKPSV
jgi:hypothetical protein